MYGAATPKRQYAFSNSPHICCLETGKLDRNAWSSQQSEVVKTTKRKRCEDGREKFTATPALRDTQQPDCFRNHELYVDIDR